MKNNKKLLMVAGAFLVFLFAMWGPEMIAKYRDRTVFYQITTETVENQSQGYRYLLSENEKIYLLSKCLNSQTLPASEQSIRAESAGEEFDYEELSGNYAFVRNRNTAVKNEREEQEIFALCNEQIVLLQELGLIPESVQPVSEDTYTAELYSAIDVTEPQNNVSVWKVSLSTDMKNVDKSNRLIDAYIDDTTGKIYEFYVRSELTWEDMEPERMVKTWSDYVGLTGMEAYETDNPLSETTSDYKKYRFPGMENGGTIVTIGCYEGINELFLKISK